MLSAARAARLLDSVEIGMQVSDSETVLHERVAHYLEAIHDRVPARDDEEPDSITLYNARWYSATGNLGLHTLSAVRISLSAVSGWWISGGIPAAPPKGSDAGAFFGIAIPLDF